MRRMSLVHLALAAGALICVSAEVASAQTASNARRANEVTVTKRSFLDPGNVVPIGSRDRYSWTVAHPAPAPGGTYRNDNFGDWLLPQNFGVPGFGR
jgi:hypothetical protein